MNDEIRDDMILCAVAAALREEDLEAVSMVDEENNKALQRLVDAGYLVRLPFEDPEKFVVIITAQGQARADRLREKHDVNASTVESAQDE